MIEPTQLEMSEVVRNGAVTGFAPRTPVRAELLGQDAMLYGIFVAENLVGVQLSCLTIADEKYVFSHVFLPFTACRLYQLPGKDSAEITSTLALARGSQESIDADRLLVSFEFGESWVRDLYPRLSLGGKNYVAKKKLLHDDAFFLDIIRARIADIHDDDDKSDDHCEETWRGAAARAIQSQEILIELARDPSTHRDARVWAYHRIAADEVRLQLLLADEKLLHLLPMETCVKKMASVDQLVSLVSAHESQADLYTHWRFCVIAELFARGAREEAATAVKKVGSQLLETGYRQGRDVRRFMLDVFLEEAQGGYEILDYARKGEGNGDWLCACIVRLLQMDYLEYVLNDIVGLSANPMADFAKIVGTDTRMKKAVDDAQNRIQITGY